MWIFPSGTESSSSCPTVTSQPSEVRRPAWRAAVPCTRVPGCRTPVAKWPAPAFAPVCRQRPRSRTRLHRRSSRVDGVFCGGQGTPGSQTDAFRPGRRSPKGRAAIQCQCNTSCAAICSMTDSKSGAQLFFISNIETSLLTIYKLYRDLQTHSMKVRKKTEHGLTAGQMRTEHVFATSCRRRGRTIMTHFLFYNRRLQNRISMSY